MLRISIYGIAVAAGAILLGSQLYWLMAQDTTPAQPYRAIKNLGKVEIRFYPPAVEASVHKSGDYSRMMNNGFRDLAGYIFGGNDRNEKIAMTTPVKTLMDAPDANSGYITFVMPQNFDLQNKPTPTSGNILFSETEPMYAAAITFGGFATRQKMEEQAILLLQELTKAGLEPHGKVQFL